MDTTLLPETSSTSAEESHVHANSTFSVSGLSGSTRIIVVSVIAGVLVLVFIALLYCACRMHRKKRAEAYKSSIAVKNKPYNAEDVNCDFDEPDVGNPLSAHMDRDARQQMRIKPLRVPAPNQMVPDYSTSIRHTPSHSIDVLNAQPMDTHRYPTHPSYTNGAPNMMNHRAQASQSHGAPNNLYSYHSVTQNGRKPFVPHHVYPSMPPPPPPAAAAAATIANGRTITHGMSAPPVLLPPIPKQIPRMASQWSEDSLDQLQQKYLAEEKNGNINRTKNPKEKNAIDKNEPDSPTDEDSDHSLYKKQHEYLQEDVNQEEDQMLCGHVTPY